MAMASCTVTCHTFITAKEIVTKNLSFSTVNANLNSCRRNDSLLLSKLSEIQQKVCKNLKRQNKLHAGGKNFSFASLQALASDGELEGLRVPESWTKPDIAAQEAEWLKARLHQWLDEEFCPEPANDEISFRCARVYQHCLLEQNTDLADILIQMVRDLEGFSFRESFHGAFSSANAAVDLITKRMLFLEAARDN